MHPALKVLLSNIEAVRKDLECTFGILKIRWNILQYSIGFRSIKTVEKLFVVCCILHNFMLSEMKTRDTVFTVGRGTPRGTDAIWIGGPREEVAVAASRAPGSRSENRVLMEKWGRHCSSLTVHLAYYRGWDRGPRHNGSGVTP